MNLYIGACNCPVTCQPCGTDNSSGGAFCGASIGSCPNPYSVSFSVNAVYEPLGVGTTVPAYSGSLAVTSQYGSGACWYRGEGSVQTIPVLPSGNMDRKIIVELRHGGSAPNMSGWCSPCAETNCGTVASACFGINVLCALGYYAVGGTILYFQHTAVFALKKNDIEDDCSEEVPCYTALTNITPHWTAEHPSGLIGSFDGIA
jgi:hypothetical protein